MEFPFARMLRVFPVLIGLLSGAVMAEENRAWVSPGDVRIGEVLSRDVTAPFDLELLDARETALARHASSATLPMVGIPEGKGAEATLNAIRDSFEETRKQFVVEVARTFHGHPVGHREANSSRFREFRLDFQRVNAGYPVGNLLALTWALDRDDARLLDPILDTVEGVFSDRWVVAVEEDEDRTGDGDLAPHGVLIVAPEPSLPELEDRLFGSGQLVDSNRIVSLDAIRENLQAELEVTYRPVSAHVVDLVRPNVRLNAAMTDAYRDWRTQSIRVVTRFEYGETILAAGQPVDQRTMLALREINTRVSVETAVAPSGIVASHPGLPVHQAESNAESSAHGFFLGILTVSVVLLVILFAIFTRRQGDRTLVSVTATGTVGNAIPDSLAAQLARELRDRVVQSLYTQREDLLRAEQTATLSVKQLEERLARLQPRILARIQAFEQRIAELEFQLAQKESENQDLIRARIDEVRSKLDAELARHDIILN